MDSHRDYKPFWNQDAPAEARRFGLRDGQMRANLFRKNLWWVLNNEIIGYGDLSTDDIENIAQTLQEGEVFECWNEHQWTDSQQVSVPIIRIVQGDFTFPSRERR